MFTFDSGKRNIASQGVYPDRKQLAELTGIDPAKAQAGLALPVIQSAT